MRPLELKLRNFRSYFGDQHVFDFRNRSLVGVVGPIGSGKSSLLDAVSFGLYGKTATAGSNTKALIHQRANDGGVMLRFEVEDQVWEVVRSLRRKGASQHALYRYDRDDPDAEPVARVTMEGDVNATIVGLLGLDYDAFGRSVLLAQGRFAEFLRSRPAERDAVLKGVFGHDRIDAMREVAKQRTVEVSALLAEIAVRTEQLERVGIRLAETRQLLEGAEERVEVLRKVEPLLHDLDVSLVAATNRHDEAMAKLEELEPHASRLPAAGAIEDLITQARANADDRLKLAAELEAAQADVAAADEAMAAEDAAGAQEHVDEAAGLLAAAAPQRRAVQEAEARLAAAERRCDGLEAEHVAAEGESNAATERLAQAEVALAEATAEAESAQARLHAAEHADMAASLRRSVAAGERCPVCEQEIPVVPSAVVSADVESFAAQAEKAKDWRAAAESARTEAAGTCSAVASQRDGLAKAIAAAQQEIDQLRKDLGESGAELQGTEQRLAAMLGEGDPAELLDEQRQAIAARSARAVEARRTAEQVRSRHDQVIVDEQAVAKRLATLRVELADLTARLGVALPVSGDDAVAIGRTATALREAWLKETTALEARRTDAAATRRKATEDCDALLAAAGVTTEFAAELGAAEATVQHLTAQVARDAAEFDAADELFAEQARLDGERTRFNRLASDLTNARFVRFLLDDERTRLAHLGSEHFQRLSSGRYRFTDDGVFGIVDLTAADAVRKAASLSGGETFLASLALALSLAEMVTRTGGRLDAFFLDEGFGALDPEHLDLAMEGIEALIAGDTSRLVVVVSHVPEMRERIEDLITLDREPLTGDTRVLRS